MSLSTYEMLALDEVISEALGKQPGESIHDAAERILDTPHGNPAWRVAAAIVHGRGDPWRVMQRAAKAALRLQRRA